MCQATPFVLDELVEGMQSVLREGESGTVELVGRANRSGHHAWDVDARGAAGPSSVPGSERLLTRSRAYQSRLGQEFLSGDWVCGQEVHNADVLIEPRNESELPLPMWAFPSAQDRAYMES